MPLLAVRRDGFDQFVLCGVSILGRFDTDTPNETKPVKITVAANLTGFFCFVAVVVGTNSASAFEDRAQERAVAVPNLSMALSGAGESEEHPKLPLCVSP